MAIFYNDQLIKTKYSLELRFHHLINTTNPIERLIKEIRRRINAIGHFENKESADKILFFISIHLNFDVMGNVSFYIF
ncbi:MAG: transposase [Ignavibacteria bacterium]